MSGRANASPRACWLAVTGPRPPVDVTPDRLEVADYACPEPHQYPLPFAAEVGIAMRRALYELPEPHLRRMRDLVLLEIG